MTNWASYLYSSNYIDNDSVSTATASSYYSPNEHNNESCSSFASFSTCASCNSTTSTALTTMETASHDALSCTSSILKPHGQKQRQGQRRQLLNPSHCRQLCMARNDSTHKQLATSMPTINSYAGSIDVYWYI